MMDFLNRRDVFLHKDVPHVVKNEKHALEEKNTIVVKHERKPIIERIKLFFKGERKK